MRMVAVLNPCTVDWKFTAKYFPRAPMFRADRQLTECRDPVSPMQEDSFDDGCRRCRQSMVAYIVAVTP